jgi:hypothetical protein
MSIEMRCVVSNFTRQVAKEDWMMCSKIRVNIFENTIRDDGFSGES